MKYQPIKYAENQESVKNTKTKSCLTKKEEDYLANYILFVTDYTKETIKKNSYILNRFDSQC